MVSSTSAAIVRARKLLRRSGRIGGQQFLAEGPQSVREALRAAAAIQLIVATDSVSRHAELLTTASSLDVEILEADEAVLSQLSSTVTPQGIVAVSRIESADLDGSVRDESSLVVILEQASDPGNVGTIIRVADAVGADAVVLTEGSVDPYNSKAVRSSAGSIFHVPVVTDVALSRVIRACHSRGMPLLATAGEAELTIFDNAVANLLKSPVAVMFGNEAHGLSEQAIAAASIAVRVPIFGSAESLNLASAASVCLYQCALAQRH